MEELSEKIRVGFAYLPVINFAMQQNKISVIHELSIENLTDNVIKDIKIILTADPEFGEAFPVFIETLSAKKVVRVESLKLNLSINYLAQLTERLSGSIILEIFSEEQSIFRKTYTTDVLAYDQWVGVTVLPEMLSAFITPNHPAIQPVIQRAATILEQWTGSPSLDEYQSRNPDRVQKQMAALFMAISEQNIIYSTIPAGFEICGQRIRLSGKVMEQKAGSCIDMALFYASCLEAAGIHALIVIINGHAFAGGWLLPETFPDNVIDDVSLLTKRIADGINEITLVETTCMNKGHAMDFDRAVKLANEQLNPSGFILAVDVKRSRFSGIRPIPQRILNGQYAEMKEDDEESVEDSYVNIPKSINPYDLSHISPEVVITKQLLWERKLLDLSLRNNLLNIKITKNTLQLIPANLDLFEDALANGEEFRIIHKPADWENPLYEYGLYQSIPESDPVIELIKAELTQKRLRSYLSENDLGKALTHLYRSSRISIEENGANTLYLALGVLKWYETKASERPRYAPVLLIPVEMIRKSAAKGYIIRTREEETMMNITLLEMLRQNFNISIPGLDPLPADEKGVDVKLIYSIIRDSIKNQAKWDVEEQAILGIFSFSRFIMWNDIHNNSNKLIRNKVVSSLMNGKIEWELNTQPADASDLDKQLSPTEIVLPINADSSQLEAIYEAIHDTSFILHGPPGTGKSQTITNLIANMLYRGKRVLFVAEKMAALSVVQSRLKAMGLDPFCLELHSNKAKKTAVLSQLKKTSEVVRCIPPEEFQKEAERLLAMRSELNLYIEALHKTYPFGISLYEAISRYQSINGEPLFDIPQSHIAGLDKETVLRWSEAVEMLISTANACGHPHNHPLTGILISDYSPEIKNEAIKSIKDAIHLLLQIKPKQQTLLDIFGEPEVFDNKQNMLPKLIERLLRIPELTPALLTHPQLSQLLNDYREVCIHGKKRDELRQNILNNFTEGVLAIDAKKTLSDWNRASAKWFLPRYFGQKKAKKQLKAYALKKIVKKDVQVDLTEIIRYQEENNHIAGFADALPSLFGQYGRNDNEDWIAIEKIIEDMSAIHTSILSIAKNKDCAFRMKKCLAGQLSEGMDSFISIYSRSLNETRNLLSEWSRQERILSGTIGVSNEQLYKDSGNWIESALSQLNRWLSGIDKLKDWYRWLHISDEMNSLQLGFIADEYRTKNIETGRLMDIFNKSYYRAVIDYIISQESSLKWFKGKIFNDVIEKYKQLTVEFEELTKKELFAQLAANLPSFTHEATQNSEVGILLRNIRNNARGTSLRKLFDQIPTLLSRMCPCMLMSPISVAQYIDADAAKFDLIVFDEASQMPTYEAVGAIARGNNVVIVGDPKQLPPTNFFMANSIDEDNIHMEDLESILDDCLALSMPSKHLLWHYRSKHESLITFSNQEYYDNKLLTFPSPDNIESKVKLVQLDGFYDKGKSRQNKAEAQAVVDEIARRLRDENLRKKSIGVVTFSSIQQSLIEDLLSDLFVFYPDLETVALECEEPLFIKNLENVQGDERDIILFSVGYGPDPKGQVSMNFGPLNRMGGERRLNVAASRARYEMIVYSTLRADQIDLNRTSSMGVAGLKRFLEYAENGDRKWNNRQYSTLPEVSVTSIIADRLRDMGYMVHTNIGCSGYKIDVGIVDPENPLQYKLGIICDGENYKRAKTVCDREIVQNGVLKMLGWNIHRIWTLDWWENQEEVIESIQKLLNKGESDSVSPPVITNMATETEGAMHPVPETIPDIPQHAKSVVEQPYLEAMLDPVNLPSEKFFHIGCQKLVLNQIKEAMETEAPISRMLLFKKVLSSWGIICLRSRSGAYLDLLLSQCGYFSSEHDGLIYFWLSEEQCNQYTGCRNKSGRDSTDLPPEEIANGMKQILTDEISLPTGDLLRICAKLFGYPRSGSIVEAAMSRGMKSAVDRGYIKIENGRAIIL